MRNDPILMHYGVKGMKWRHRKRGIGAMEGVLNNPAAGGESKSNRYAPKSKVRKDETSYTNLRLKRLAQLQNKGVTELKKEAGRHEVKKGLDAGVAKGISAMKIAKEKSKSNAITKGMEGGLKPNYNTNKKSVRDSENNPWFKKKKGKL
jgi:hypothetical protein